MSTLSLIWKDPLPKLSRCAFLSASAGSPHLSALNPPLRLLYNYILVPSLPNCLPLSWEKGLSTVPLLLICVLRSGRHFLLGFLIKDFYFCIVYKSVSNYWKLNFQIRNRPVTLQESVSDTRIWVLCHIYSAEYISWPLRRLFLLCGLHGI